jgi:hypothetical protein
VLVRGTERVRGIPVFGRNAIPALFGEYLVMVGAEVLSIQIWYTREPLAVGVDWIVPVCRGLPSAVRLLSSRTADGGELVVATSPDYQLAMVFPPAYSESCRFTVVLIERFSWFMGYAAREEDYSFPAFLELD